MVISEQSRCELNTIQNGLQVLIVSIDATEFSKKLSEADASGRTPKVERRAV